MAMSSRVLGLTVLLVGGAATAAKLNSTAWATAVDSFTKAKESVQQSGAVSSLRAVHVAQQTYASACGNSYYSPSLENLGTPSGPNGEPFLPPDLGKAGAVAKGGYVIRMRTTAAAESPDTCNGLPSGQAARAYVVVAEPLPGGTGLHYAMNANGTIYQHTESLENAMPDSGRPAVGDLAK